MSGHAPDYVARIRFRQAPDHAPEGRGGAVYEVITRASDVLIGTVTSAWSTLNGAHWLATRADGQVLSWGHDGSPQPFTTRNAAASALVRDGRRPDVWTVPATGTPTVPEGWLAIVAESGGGIVGYLDPAHEHTIRRELAPKEPPL